MDDHIRAALAEEEAKRCSLVDGSLSSISAAPLPVRDQGLLSAVSQIFGNLAAAVTRRPFRLAQGEYGTKLVMKGPWEASVAGYMQRHRICELELKYVEGFSYVGDTPHFLSLLPHLTGLEIAYPEFKNLEQVGSLNGLRYLS
jgi:hypothetical protein